MAGNPVLNSETRRLMLTPEFRMPVHFTSPRQRALLSLQKAKIIAGAYALSLQDIRSLTPKFWSMHSDPIVCLDGAATTLLTIQYNLALGTILDHANGRSDLDGLIDDLLQYNVSGQFCLTEIGHGLDAINLETTATELSNGEGFLLNTPSPSAVKYMPPTVPSGIPCVAIVFARLLVDCQDKGIRPFIVPINDGTHMCPGVTARLLPPREGATPVNHALTSFDRVHLPPNAILSDQSLASSEVDERHKFLSYTRRVAVGSLALAGTTIPGLARGAYTTAQYSRRRFVASGRGQDAHSIPMIPIMNFKTQQIPILVSLSQSLVLTQFYNVATSLFRDNSTDPRVRHGVGAIFKVSALRQMQDANISLSERCGAQGLFAHNGMSQLHADMRGIAIAEGDLLGLSIRLVSEILLERYTLPASSHPSSFLAAHEQGLISECRQVLLGMDSHRSNDFNRLILPRCQFMVESIGHRMAYDAAIDAGLDESAVSLYMVSAMKNDPSWYSENLSIYSKKLFAMEEAALNNALPKLDAWMEATGAKDYATAPIISEDRWSEFVATLEVFSSRKGTQSRL